MYAQPLIAVDDVVASTRWYQYLLNGDDPPESDHADGYERIVSNGRLLLQLHSWDDEDHPNLQRKGIKAGHGVLLWFQVDDFDAALGRIGDLKAEVVQNEHENPKARHREIWIRDADGHVVVLASPDGEQSGVHWSQPARSIEVPLMAGLADCEQRCKGGRSSTHAAWSLGLSPGCEGRPQHSSPAARSST